MGVDATLFFKVLDCKEISSRSDKLDIWVHIDWTYIYKVPQKPKNFLIAPLYSICTFIHVKPLPIWLTRMNTDSRSAGEIRIIESKIIPKQSDFMDCLTNDRGL